MRVLRSLLFDGAFYGLTVLFGIVALPALAGPRALSVRVGRVWAGAVLALLARTVGITCRIRGEAHRPPGPAIYAFKHQSAWETLVLVRLFADPAIIVKRELFGIPIFGWFLARQGMIPIDRRTGAAAVRRTCVAARERLADGRDIVVFPEGTRTRPGAAGRYRPGVAALYRDLSVPVVPVALDSGLYWPRRSFVKRPGCITLAFLPPIAPGLPVRDFLRRLEERIESETARLLEAEPGPG